MPYYFFLFWCKISTVSIPNTLESKCLHACSVSWQPRIIQTLDILFKFFHASSAVLPIRQNIMSEQKASFRTQNVCNNKCEICLNNNVALKHKIEYTRKTKMSEQTSWFETKMFGHKYFFVSIQNVWTKAFVAIQMFEQ